jgi:ketosteroid isomerase-like protein
MSPSSFAASLVATFAASDAAAYFSHFHPDATFLFHDTPGLIESRADYEALWAEWERDAGFRVLACESTDQHVQQHGDLAVFTHSVRTRSDTWTCIHEHLSPDPAWS